MVATRVTTDQCAWNGEHELPVVVVLWEEDVYWNATRELARVFCDHECEEWYIDVAGQEDYR